MDNVYEIVFKQDKHTVMSGGYQNAMLGWIRINRGKIRILHASYQKAKIDDHNYVDAIYLKYSSDQEFPAVMNCAHSSTTIETIPATCTMPGKKITYCATCGIQMKEEVIPMLPHQLEEKKVADATCHKPGRIDQVCSVCKQIISSKEIPMISHTESDEVLIEGDCESASVVIKKCSACGDYLGKVVSTAQSHTWVSNGDGTHTCSKCGKTETCYPNDYEDICEVCGYQTPPDIVLQINTASINEMTMGTVFNQKLQANVADDLHWSKVSGEFPAGIQLVNDTISGTPNDYGDFNVTIRATYHKQTVDTQYSIHVKDSVVLKITSTVLNNGVINEAYPESKVECNIPVNQCTMSMINGNLPNGITFDSGTGVLSGIPTESGSFTSTIQAVYHDQTVSKQFSIYIAEGPCTVTFNPTTGTVSETSRQVTKGSMIGELPVPTSNTDEKFIGWYTSEVGGMKIEPTYTITTDVTFYARWGFFSDIEFGEVIPTFNIHINDDRTNYNDQPYTLYGRSTSGGAANLAFQTGISSQDGSNNMTDSNNEVTLYLKITNEGDADSFDIGFDCDSYVSGDDKVKIERIQNGVRLADKFSVTAPGTVNAWVGKYNERTSNRYVDVNVGTVVGTGTDEVIDTGYTFTIKDVFINNGAYAIIAVTFHKE